MTIAQTGGMTKMAIAIGPVEDHQPEKKGNGGDRVNEGVEQADEYQHRIPD
jgi:hypothetical protein